MQWTHHCHHFIRGIWLMPLHFFANTYTGWLNATTGICSGFKYATASFQASKECLIMVGDLASSLNTSRSADKLGCCFFSAELLAWYAAHERFSGSLITCVDFTCSSHLRVAFRKFCNCSKSCICLTS